MTRRFWSLFSSFITTGALALYTAHPVLYFFTLALLGMLVFSLLSVLCARLSVRLQQACSDSPSIKGSTIQLLFQVRNHGPLPIAYITIKFALPNFGVGAPVKTLECSVRPFGRRQLQVPVYCELRGFYAPGVQAAHVQDLFRVFRMRLRLPPPLLLQVCPLVTEGAGAHAPGARGDVKTQPFGALEDPSAPDDIRPWREGDTLKHVHWKISARKDAWFVRTFESPTQQQTAFLIDGGSPSLWGASYRQCLLWQDALIECAVSMARALHGQALHILSAGSTLAQMTTQPGTDFALPYSFFSNLRFDGNQPFSQVYASQRHGIGGNGLILFTPELTEELLSVVASLPKGARAMVVVCRSPGDAELQKIRQLGVSLLVHGQENEVSAA